MKSARCTFVVLLFVLQLVPRSVEAQTVFVVRHAERADGGGAASGADPDLSKEGHARAEALASILKDTGITGIFVSEFRRTRQTAEPLAKLLGLDPVAVSSNDTAGLVDRVRAAPGNVLVVGHSNTVPEILKALGVEQQIRIADTEFDNLFVVTRTEKPSFIRLRYQ